MRTRSRGETGRAAPSLLLQLLEVLRLLRRTRLGLGDALGLLAAQLRSFEDYERQREEAAHLPLPGWLYRQDSVGSPPTDFTTSTRHRNGDR